MSRGVSARGKDVHLTPKEFRCAELLIEIRESPHAPKIAADRLGPDYGEETENLRVVINQLRKRLKAIRRTQIIS